MVGLDGPAEWRKQEGVQHRSRVQFGLHGHSFAGYQPGYWEERIP